MEIFSELSHWIVLGLVILIVSFVFFSKTGLMPKVASALLSAVDRWLPIKPDKGALGTSPDPEAVINAQKQLLDDMARNTNDGECLLNLRDLSALQEFKDYSIGVSNDNNKLYSVIFKKTGKSGAPQRIYPTTREQELQVCVINPKQFYDCFLSSKKPADSKVCSSGTYRIAEDGIRINEDKITLSSSPDADTYGFLQKYLFKPEANKVCFVPTYGGAWTWFGCDASNKGIDDDCLDKIRNTLPLCSGQVDNLQLCQIMYECARTTNTELDEPKAYCTKNRPATRWYSEEKCNIVRDCAAQATSQYGIQRPNCERVQNALYILSFQT